MDESISTEKIRCAPTKPMPMPTPYKLRASIGPNLGRLSEAHLRQQI